MKLDMKVSDDTFIHFTKKEYGKLILDSKKILTSKSTSVSGEAFAVSISYGIFSPYLPMEIYKGTDKLLCAVIFTTSTKPKDAGIGQVVWNKDVKLKTAKIIKFSEAKKLLDYNRLRIIPLPSNTSNILYK